MKINFFYENSSVEDTYDQYKLRSGYTSGYGRIAWGTIRPDTDK